MDLQLRSETVVNTLLDNYYSSMALNPGIQKTQPSHWPSGNHILATR